LRVPSNPLIIDGQPLFSQADSLCAGRKYALTNIFFEALLILDMFTHCCRAFYNAKGILVYDLKDIRTRYLSSRFFPDLIAALPLQAVIALNGHVNDRYSAWLRMPKMIRVYRLMEVYAALQKETGQVGVAVGVLRLLPLLFCLTHLYGCASPDSALLICGMCC
jgi:hypothetical protein